MADQEQDRLIKGIEIQQLMGAAYNKQSSAWLEKHGLTEPTRSRPWTSDEIHVYLLQVKKVDSVKKVKLSDHAELLAVFSGEPVVDTPAEQE
jgi:hypothetical protein